MKPLSNPVSAHSIEPLEGRIAPARVIVTGVPNTLPGDDVDYTDTTAAQAFFVNTETNPLDQISGAVGGGKAGVADTFYLRMSAGDLLQIFNSTNGPQDYLTVKKGNIVAFFVDKDLDNEIDEGELTGIAMGKNASLILKNGVEGDIVSNFDDQGDRLIENDALVMTGLISNKQGIQGVTIGGGNVGGSIISGGNISNLIINGTVNSILAGSAASGKSFDFFPNTIYANAIGDGMIGTGEGTIAPFTPADGVAGPSIKNVVVDGLNVMMAGAGGAGAKGGSIFSLRITEDNDGATIQAGAGGDAGGRLINGGAGGTVKRVLIAPEDAGDTSANSLVSILGGPGGDAPAGRGGKGGMISDVFVSYRAVGGKSLQTISLLADNITIAAGPGGDGKFGGAGGNLLRPTIAVVTPDVFGDEVQLFAGTGGMGTATLGGKAGSGGSVLDVNMANLNPVPGAGLLIQAGDGGLTVASSAGAKGGAVTDVNALATNVKVFAGDGSAGTVGGHGGSVRDVKIDAGGGFFSRNASVSAGFGGAGALGNGGNGGNVTTVRIENGDFFTLNINEGAAADGGNSGRGRGGKGGNVTGLDFFDGDLAGADGDAVLRTGNGGDGTTAGGKGGSLKTGVIVAVDMNVTVLMGNGGDVASAAGRGRGGAGGNLTNFEVQADGNVNGTSAFTTIRSGAGGDGAGTGGAGGKGGDLRNVSVRAEGAGILAAGDGGSGTSGAAGNGGSIFTSGVFASGSSALLSAGDAGAGGARPGRGGNITGTPASLSGAYAFSDLTITAGDGTHGGAGGSLRNVGYGSTTSTLLPTPGGTIFVKAGNGSVDGSFAGAGGSLKAVSGAISSGTGKTTTIEAGDGGTAILPLAVAETTPGDVAAAEVQTLNLSALTVASKATFSLGFGGVSTPQLALVIANETPAEMAARIGAALNALAPITTAGGVTVAPGAAANTFTITFTANGNQALLSATGSLGTKAGAGGSIDNLIIERGGATDGLVAIRAGDGGDTFGAAGAKGGNVKRISIGNISDLVTLRSISAGDGGDGAQRGGGGGSITMLDVAGHDVGVRSGLAFGFNSMGGLFAGTGGSAMNVAGNPQANPGSVTGVTAQAIASIVAGKSLAPFDVVETTKGDAPTMVREVQTLDVSSIAQFGKAAFSLRFNGETTASLPLTIANETAADVADRIADALNALASVTTAGGVTVAPGAAANTFDVTFNTEGDQPAILGLAGVVSKAGKALTPGLVAKVNNVLLTGLDLIKDSTGGLLHTFPDLVNATLARMVVSFNGVDSLVITAGLPANDGALPDNDPDDVEDILNAMTTVAAAGGVTVTGNYYSGYQVKFVTPGNQLPTFTATELFELGADELIPGAVALNSADQAGRIVFGDDAPPTQEVQFFTIDPDASFSVTFGADTTPPLPANADAITVQNALNALPSIIATQAVPPPGNIYVTVEQDPVNHRFIVTFTEFDAQPSQLSATALRNEVQRVDGYATGELIFSFGVNSTPGHGTPGVLAHDATPAEVQAALNALPSIQATGPGNTGAVTVTAAPNGAYDIAFNTLGNKTGFVLTQYVDANPTTEPTEDAPGSTITPPGVMEVQVISIPARSILNPSFLPSANFVGGFADAFALSGGIFRYIDLGGTAAFELGDMPIDGLILTRSFAQPTVNFVPEAMLVGTEFRDFLNTI